jgi:hypothetical protein
LGNGDFTSGAIYTIDRTFPTVLSILRASPNPTSKNSVNFTVTFSRPVTNVDDPHNFSIYSTGVTHPYITQISGSGAIYIVTVNPGLGNGTVHLNLFDHDLIFDEINSNPLGGYGESNGGFTSGQTYTVHKGLTVNSVSTQDGWVLESSETSKKGGSINSSATTFRLGDDVTKKQYLDILSFSTGSLPDNAVITGVTLKVKKSAVVGGGNPLTIFQGFMVDVKKGLFGTAALQSTDFQTLASKTVGPFTPALVSGWYSLDLTSAQASINKMPTASGLTQIRLRFKLDDNNNALANYLNLYSGNASAASRPQLIIQYYVQ